MIKRNKTIATMMAVALFANSMPCVNAFAADTAAGDNASAVAVENDTEESITTDEKSDETTTGAAVEVKDEATDEKDFKFDASTGTITGYVGNSEKIVVPSEINGVEVTGIDEYAFMDYNLSQILKEVDLPDTIKNIGSFAFANNMKLEKINIPSGVTEISKGAFTGCSNLDNISLPDTITEIGERAFDSCYSIDSISIPEGVIEIKESTFRDCTCLNKVTLPKSVTKIGREAFYNDKNAVFYVGNGDVKQGLLDNGIEKDKIKGIDADAEAELNFKFDASTGTITKYIGYDENVEVPSEIRGVKVTGIGEQAFYGDYIGKTVKSVKLPDTIDSIGKLSFYDCENLESINIPQGVTEIQGQAFFGCTNLKNVTLPNSVAKIDEYTFAHCTNLKELTIPGTLTYVGQGAFTNNNALFYVNNNDSKQKLLEAGISENRVQLLNVTDEETVKAEETVTDGSEFSFDKSTGRIRRYIGSNDTVVVPEEIDGVKVTNIGTGFDYLGGKNIKKLVLPKTITNIPEKAFKYNKTLEEVVLPDTVKTIGSDAFSNCVNLKKVNVPESVSKIGDMAFGYCYSLESAEVPGNVSNLGTHTFYQCKNLKDVTLGSGISKVSMCMFTHCKSLENLTLPDSIKEIKYAAFDDVNPDVKIHVTSDSVKKLLLRAGIKEEQID